MEYTGKKYFTDKCRELHRLIRSLTKGQHIGLHPQLPPKRQKLYDLYRKMEDHDPSVIRAAFPDDTTASINLNKNVLLDEVIRYRYDFAPHNGRRDLANLIGEADDLRAEGFEAFAIYRIDAAIRLAINIESMADLYAAVKVRQKLIDPAQDIRVVGKELAQLERQAIAGMEETIRINHIYSAFYNVSLQSAEEKKQSLVVIGEDLKSMPVPILLRNQIQFRNARLFLFQQKRDVSAAMDEAKSIIQIAESKTVLLADSDLREIFFKAITFLAVCYAEQKEFSTSESYLENLRVFSSKLERPIESNPSINARYIYTNLVAKIALKDWSAALSLSKKVFKEFVQGDSLGNTYLKSALLSLAAFSAFLSKDYQLTRRLLLSLRSSITPSRVLTGLTDKVTWAGIVLLLSYVDEENSFLKVVMKETTAWMKSFGPLGKYDQIMLRFYGKVSEDPDCKASKSSLLELRKELQLLFSKSEFAIQSEMFPMIQWIDSKLEDRDLRSFDIN